MSSTNIKHPLTAHRYSDHVQRLYTSPVYSTKHHQCIPTIQHPYASHLHITNAYHPCKASLYSTPIKHPYTAPWYITPINHPIKHPCTAHTAALSSTRPSTAPIYDTTMHTFHARSLPIQHPCAASLYSYSTPAQPLFASTVFKTTIQHAYTPPIVFSPPPLYS